MNKNNDVKITGCPFCGTLNPEIINGTHSIHPWYVAVCSNDTCSSEGPIKNTLDDAIRAWNTRVESE